MSDTATPWNAACQASLSFTISWSLLKLMSIESAMPFNHLILCHPLLLLLSVLPNIKVFSNESALSIRWPKYWSFSFSISPPNEYSGLISFRMDWLDLPAVQGTLKSLLQHQSSKASILRRSAFFIVQLWHPYMTTGKTIALTRQTFYQPSQSYVKDTGATFWPNLSIYTNYNLWSHFNFTENLLGTQLFSSKIIWVDFTPSCCLIHL